MVVEVEELFLIRIGGNNDFFFRGIGNCKLIEID